MGKLEHMMKVVLLLLIGVLAVSAAPTWTKTLTTQLSDVGGHTTTSCHCNGCSADKHTVAMADNATACAQACIAANNANANAGVSSQGLSRFTCWQPADTTVSTPAPGVSVTDVGLGSCVKLSGQNSGGHPPYESGSGVSECSSGN